MKRLLAQFVVFALGVATLAGCGSGSDGAQRMALAALNPKAAQPSSAPQSQPTPRCTDLTASLRPPAVMPAPGAMPPGSFMAKIKRRGYLLAGVNAGFLTSGT